MMKSYKEKQRMIKANLEEIATMEREIAIAKMLMDGGSKGLMGIDMVDES